jgi:plastocyanin
MRRLALLLALALGVMAWPLASALAMDQEIQATSGNEFQPPDVSVNVGDTVTWQNNTGSSHNVAFDDGSFKGGGDPVTHSPAPGPWQAQFKFTKVGTFLYHCEQHGGNGGVGMSGKVVVTDPNDQTPPTISDLKAKPKKFCTNKSENCHKRGTKIRFTLSEDAVIRADVTQADKFTGALVLFKKHHFKAGKNSFKLKGKGLKPGSWRIRLQPTDGSGNVGIPAHTKFVVKHHG